MQRAHNAPPPVTRVILGDMELDEYIKKVVAEAPLLTEEQVSRIARLLAPTLGSRRPAPETTTDRTDD